MPSSSVDRPPRGVDLSALQPVLETALDAVVVMDGAGRVLDWSRCAEEIFGWTREEAMGRTVAELIVPERLRAAHRAGLKRLVETGETRILGQRVELTGLRRDGGEVPVELAVTPWRDGAGETVFLGFLRDLSKAREAAQALRVSEARLSATQANAQVGLTEADHEGRFLRVNAAFCTIAGYTPEELIGQRTFFELTWPEDRKIDRDLYARQVAGERAPYRLEKRYVHKGGDLRWVNVSSSGVYDAKGRFLYGVRAVQDITEHKRAEARQILLVNELNHRVKNILQLVKALAVLTGQGATDVATFQTAFNDRIDALAKSHDLLIREHWGGADLRELLTHELAAYAARDPGCRALSLEGPTVRLDARSAVALALVAHELATNAAKYGALSAPGGTVKLEWRWVEDAEPTPLQIVWTECGGPAVTPPSRRGFGSRLIERLAKTDLGGEAAFDYRPEGLQVVLTIRPEGGS